MKLIDRLDMENRARALTDEESAALCDAVRREKINARRRVRRAETRDARSAALRARYASDPEFRARVLVNNEASRQRAKGRHE